jgi:hypothetical protein
MIGDHAVVATSGYRRQINSSLIASDQFLAFWVVRDIDTLLNDVLIWNANAIMVVDECCPEGLVAFEQTFLMVAELQIVLSAHTNAVIYSGVTSR